MPVQFSEPGSSVERRAHRRLGMRLPVQCRREALGQPRSCRMTTLDISPAGVCLDTDAADFRPGERLQLDFSLPAAEGVFPYPGRATCEAEVIRVDRLAEGGPGRPGRFRVAARFLQGLRVSY